MKTYDEISAAANEAGEYAHGKTPTEARVHYRVGFIDGSKWMQEQQPKWIPVSERLPDKNQFVLTLRENTLPHVVSSFYAPSKTPLSETGWYNVTHWMPLPAAPANASPTAPQV